jgi:uncharacterized membrane protein
MSSVGEAGATGGRSIMDRVVDYIGLGTGDLVVEGMSTGLINAGSTNEQSN